MAPGPGPYAGVGALGPIWGGALGALGPIWGGASGRPKADIMEAEGRLNGGLGAKPPGIWGPWALLALLSTLLSSALYLPTILTEAKVLVRVLCHIKAS